MKKFPHIKYFVFGIALSLISHFAFAQVPVLEFRTNGVKQVSGSSHVFVTIRDCNSGDVDLVKANLSKHSQVRSVIQGDVDPVKKKAQFELILKSNPDGVMLGNIFAQLGAANMYFDNDLISITEFPSAYEVKKARLEKQNITR
jgi:hypothetical protein